MILSLYILNFLFNLSINSKSDKNQESFGKNHNIFRSNKSNNLSILTNIFEFKLYIQSIQKIILKIIQSIKSSMKDQQLRLNRIKLNQKLRKRMDLKQNPGLALRVQILRIHHF